MDSEFEKWVDEQVPVIHSSDYAVMRKAWLASEKRSKARDAKLKKEIAEKRNEKAKQELSQESAGFNAGFRAGLEWVLLLLEEEAKTGNECLY